jgi:NAD(P)-dependent dehydrogenase (short-subunit alcohol dehydrogenase family)
VKADGHADRGEGFRPHGGGNGIGREVVLGLISRGERVAAVDLSESGPTETARLTAAAEGLLTSHVLNVSDRPAVEKLPGDAVTAPVSPATCKRWQPTVGWE